MIINIFICLCYEEELKYILLIYLFVKLIFDVKELKFIFNKCVLLKVDFSFFILGINLIDKCIGDVYFDFFL